VMLQFYLTQRYSVEVRIAYAGCKTPVKFA